MSRTLMLLAVLIGIIAWLGYRHAAYRRLGWEPEPELPPFDPVLWERMLA